MGCDRLQHLARGEVPDANPARVIPRGGRLAVCTDSQGLDRRVVRELGDLVNAGSAPQFHLTKSPRRQEVASRIEGQAADDVTMSGAGQVAFQVRIDKR